jgi:hypothetical protein
MKNNFKIYSVLDFNLVFDTHLKANMTFAEFIDEIEEKEVSYFYVSMDENDVTEAIENEKEIAEQLDLRLIYISDLGVFIATY